MNPKILITCFIMVLLFSCKKDNDDNSSGGNTGSKKLLKQELTSGQFSGSFTFVYDTGGKLAKVHQESSGGGSTTRQGFSISRNTAGMIEKLVYLDDGSRGDSLTILVSSSGNRYTKAVESSTRFGSTTTYTTEFTYDNDGRIVKTKDVGDFDGNVTEPYFAEYTYQNNNVAKAKFTYLNNGITNLFSEENFVYDNKNNPLPFGNEWILYSLTFTDFSGWSSANNITRHTIKQPGSSDEVINTSYTYNSQNLPVTATVSSPGQPAVTLTYTYEQ